MKTSMRASERSEQQAKRAASEASSKRSELVATSVGVAGSLRSQLASLDEDENTRDESRKMATDITATSTTKLTHTILLARLLHSWFIKIASRFARRSLPRITTPEFWPPLTYTTTC